MWSGHANGLDSEFPPTPKLCFAGFWGLVGLPEYGWEWNIKTSIVTGKIVMMLVNDPGFGTEDEAFFKGNTMTY